MHLKTEKENVALGNLHAIEVSWWTFSESLIALFPAYALQILLGGKKKKNPLKLVVM